MAGSKLDRRDAGRELARLLTKERVKRIDDSKSLDPDLEKLRAVVRKAKTTKSQPGSALLEKASKFLS